MWWKYRNMYCRRIKYHNVSFFTISCSTNKYLTSKFKLCFSFDNIFCVRRHFHLWIRHCNLFSWRANLKTWLIIKGFVLNCLPGNKPHLTNLLCSLGINIWRNSYTDPNCATMASPQSEATVALVTGESQPK